MTVTRWITSLKGITHGIHFDYDGKQVTLCDTPIPVLSPRDNGPRWQWTAYGASRPKTPLCKKCEKILQ